MTREAVFGGVGGSPCVLQVERGELEGCEESGGSGELAVYGLPIGGEFLCLFFFCVGCRGGVGLASYRHREDCAINGWAVSGVIRNYCIWAFASGFEY